MTQDIINRLAASLLEAAASKKNDDRDWDTDDEAAETGESNPDEDGDKDEDGDDDGSDRDPDDKVRAPVNKYFFSHIVAAEMMQRMQEVNK